MISTPTEPQPHPALARLVDRSAATNFAIRNNALDQRARQIARRRRLAAQHGIQLDHNGMLIPNGNVVIGANDSDSDVSI